MTYQIVLAPAAARQLRKFDPDVRRRIQAVIELLAVDPRPPAATQLVGGLGEWQVRTSNYRIIYEINDNELVILVLRMGYRREIYDRQGTAYLDCCMSNSALAAATARGSNSSSSR